MSRPRIESIGPAVVALAGVVVDDVEDDLEAGRVERLDHGLELIDLAPVRAGRGVLGVRREETDGVVAPVVAQPAIEQESVMDEVVHRQQLHRGHAEVRQVFDGGGMGQSRVGAAEFLGHRGMAHGEALDVRLVEDRLRLRHERSGIVAPVEIRAHDDRAWHVGGTVLGLLAEGLAGDVAVDGITPAHVALDGPGIRVEQQLAGVAAPASGRVPGAMDTVAVALARADAWQVAVPGEAGHLRQVHAGLTTGVVEEAQLDAFGDTGEDGEVGAVVVRGRAERVGLPGPRVVAGRRGWLGSAGGQDGQVLVNKQARRRRRAGELSESEWWATLDSNQ